MERARQCELNGSVCGSQEPYSDEIMAGGLLCAGCGRSKPNVKYVRVSADVAALLDAAATEKTASEQELPIPTNVESVAWAEYALELEKRLEHTKEAVTTFNNLFQSIFK